MINQDRFKMTVVSVSAAGLTQRPAIMDTQTGKLVQVFNKSRVHGIPEEVRTYWRDGHGTPAVPATHE